MIQSDSESMFGRIIPRKEAFYKSQQRNEPDLTDDEKLNILRDLFANNSKLFLSRYHPFLSLDDLKLFENPHDDYDIRFYLDQIKTYGVSTSKTSSSKPPHDEDNSVKVAESRTDKINSASRRKSIKTAPIVRNRRYAALRKLVKEGDYFSDSEMKIREPLLYEQMVGRYLSSEEMEEIFQCGSHNTKTMSEMFMAFAENQRAAEVRENEELMEQAYKMTIHRGQFDDSDSGSESEMEDEPDEEEETQKPVEKISSDEKERRREEFTAMMHERFLAGKDEDHYDYATVDFNPAYDPMDLISQDAEDSYFDSEEPS